MSRLKELNETLTHQPAGTTQARFIDVNDAVIRARQTQGEVLAKMIRGGPAALAQFVKQALVTPVTRTLRRRRTINELKGLSDQCLEDIGVRRDEIETLAERLTTEGKPAKPARPSLIERLRRNWVRHAAIRDLQLLPDWALADIGLSRGMIPSAVDGLFDARDAKKMARPAAKSPSAVRGILARVMTEAPYLPEAKGANGESAHLPHEVMAKLAYREDERTQADNENAPHVGVA